MVRAEDNGAPKRVQSARVSVLVVAVTKQSTHAPIVKTPDQLVEVTENDAPGFLVTLVQALDEDDDQLWFDIIGEIYCFSSWLWHMSISRVGYK